MADVGIIKLFEAVADRNEVKVKELIAKGISPNSFKDESHITPLHYCTQVGDVQMFKLLLENNASLRKRDRWMDSVVHYACRHGNVKILTVILKENSRQQNKIPLKQKEKFGTQSEKKLKGKKQKVKHNLLNLKGKECKLPISEAIINRHISCVVLLFNEGAVIDIRHNNSKAPIDLLFDLPSDMQIDLFEKWMPCDVNMEVTNIFLVTLCKYCSLYENEKIQKKCNEILDNFRQIDRERWLEIFLAHDCIPVVKKLLKEPNYYTWNVLQSVLKKAVECNHEEIVRLVLNEQTGLVADVACIKLCVKNQSIRILQYLLQFSVNMKSWRTDERIGVIGLALETGNIDVVTVLFDQFHNPLDHVEIDKNLWIKLIVKQSEEIIKYLLNVGMKLDHDTRLYNFIKTPLIAAIESKNERILKCIVCAGANPGDPQHALQAAIATQCIGIVKLALTLPGSNLNDQKITTAAIQTKNKSFLASLISLGLKLNYPDMKSWSVLTTAVETKELNIVKLVYNTGATFSKSKDEIWKAVVHSSVNILDFLVRRCSIVKLFSKSAWTPLHEAVMRDNLENVKLLVENMRQHDINISGKKLDYVGKFETPLSLAVSRKNIEIINYLISAGADIITGGQTLYNGVITSSEEIMTILLKGEIPTYLDGTSCITLLHVAVILGNVNIIKQLLQLTDININEKADLSYTLEHQFKQKFGNFRFSGHSYGITWNDDLTIPYYEYIKNETTPIQIAMRLNFEDVSIELLNNNADITIPNKIGHLPWVTALLHANNGLLRILLKHYQSRNFQIDVNATLSQIENRSKHYLWHKGCNHYCENGTPLHFAVSSGNLEGVQILIEHGASLSNLNRNGETAMFGLNLLFNERDKMFGGVTILTKYGANINHINAEGSTVLNEAVEHGNSELVNVLILEGADITSIKDETVKGLLKSDRTMIDKYLRRINTVLALLQNGYHFQDISKVEDCFFSMTGDYYEDQHNINMSKAQDTICQILYHIRSLGYDIKTIASKLLVNSAKYEFQILAKYLLTEGCDPNASYQCLFSERQENVLEIAFESCNIPLMIILVDAGARFRKESDVRNVMNNVLKHILHNRQSSTYNSDAFNIEGLFLSSEWSEFEITRIINLFDAILKQDIYLEEVFTLKYFNDSPIARSIKKNLPWALTYFIHHETMRNKLHSNAVFICKMFDLLLENFHISTAKILINEFGLELVQSYPTILHTLLKLFKRHYFTMATYHDFVYTMITEEEVIDLLRSLIDQGLNINSRDDDGCTILHHATFCNAENVVNFLVEKQCDANCIPYDWNTNCRALEFAIRNGKYQIAEFLLPAYDMIKSNQAESLILNVSKEKKRNVDDNFKRKFVKNLLKCVTSASSYENLLKIAVSENDCLIVKMLIDDRCQIYKQKKKQMLSVFYLNVINASKCHFVEIIEEFLNVGVELKFKKRATPLHYMCALPQRHVCTQKCFNMLKMLIRQGNMTNMEDEEGKLPLHYAIYNLNHDAVKLLVEATAVIAPNGPGSMLPLSIYLSNTSDFEKYLGSMSYNHRVTLIATILLKTGKGLFRNIVPAEVIHDAFAHAREELLFLLSKYTTHLEYNDSDGNTGLHVSCKHDTSKILVLLLKREGDINAQNNAGKTPLLLACEHGKYDFVTLLVEHGAKPDVPDNIGITPIHMCIINGLYEAVLLFLSKPCNVNIKTKSDYSDTVATIKAGSTPLLTILTILTIKYCNCRDEIVEKLIDAGADVNICNKDRNTPLHLAVKITRNESVLRILLSRSMHIEVNAINNVNCRTPLYLACENSDYTSVKLLVEHGAKTDIPDLFGITVIDKCILTKFYDALLLFWSKPCNINKKIESDPHHYESIRHSVSTPLITVLMMNTYESHLLAEKLIDVGANVNICNEYGESPLHIALKYRCEESFIHDKLIDVGADVNILNRYGESPLHIAMRHRCEESFFTKLLTRSVNICIQDTKGWSVLHIAVDKNKVSHAQLILTEINSVNAKINCDSMVFPGYTALHIAVHHTHLSLVDMLLKSGGSIFEQDARSKTSMDLCVINKDMTKKLLLWPILIKAGGSVRKLMTKSDLLKILKESNLLDILIESGCVLQFEEDTWFELEESLFDEICAKQHKLLSLKRLAANTVRTNLYPNALCSTNKLPLPVSVQRFICFDDNHHDVKFEMLQSFSNQTETHSNVKKKFRMF